MATFTADKITDQKRLARGEHLLMARTILRQRDCVHHNRWRALMLAGPSPHGEIAAMRELMVRLHITAVDKDQACLAAAIDAGADEVVHCDLAKFTYAKGSIPLRPAQELAQLERFDLMHLDFCGVPTPQMQRIIVVYHRMLTKGGVCIVTFAYGRDVAEMFLGTEVSARLDAVPDQLAERVQWLCGWLPVRSVISYRGAAMPMCSILTSGEHAYNTEPASYVGLEPGDFELAVTCPDPAKLFDCPQERIESLRRTHAALRAAYTRKQRHDL